MNSFCSEIDVVILAGGASTRLQNILPGQQKVTAEVNEDPFINLIIKWLISYGVKNITLALGYKAKETYATIQNQFNDDNITFHASIEDKPLGTAGALKHALKHLSRKNLLVLNGDSYCPIDLKLFHDFHIDRQSIVSLIVKDIKNTERFGTLEITSEGVVTAFREKEIVAPEQPKTINCGIYLINREVIESLTPDTNISLEEDVLSNLLSGQLYAYKTDQHFIDIGIPESYQFANSPAFWAN